jgi:GNAT superfamily N-acetyltransferase
MATRNATLEDIPLLVSMMAEFYAEANLPLDRAWAGASFSALLADSTRGSVWIVSHEGEPAGYVVLTVRFSMEYGGLDAFIDDLFVRPPHRRKGLGYLALQAVLTDCRRRGVHAVHVDVDRNNTPAKCLYAKYGLVLRDDGRQMLTLRL